MRERLRGHLLAMFTMLVWGLTFISTKALLKDFTPVEILFNRFAVGFAALALIRPRPFRLRPLAHELCFAGAAFFGIVLYFLLENTALRYSLASNVSVIVSAAPFFTAIVNRLFGDGEPLRRNFLIGLALAMTGIALLSFNSRELSINPLGDFLALLAGMAWAFYSVIVRKAYALGYGSLEITRSIFAYALLLTAPVMLLLGYEVRPWALALPENLGNILFLGLIATGLCFFTWNISVKLIGVVRASAYIYGQPVVTAIAAIFLLGEKLTPYSVAGIALTILGLVISERRATSVPA